MLFFYVSFLARTCIHIYERYIGCPITVVSLFKSEFLRSFGDENLNAKNISRQVIIWHNFRVFYIV